MKGDGGDLAALIGSRLCHDLVSPLGAIGNGLELLQMTQVPTPEMDLVGEAVKVALARLRLFRLAFGVASAGATVTGPDLTEALRALEANGRITLRATIPAPLPRQQARRLALAALCMESALAWGGQIEATPTGLSGHAPRLRLDPALWGPLQQGTPPTDVTAADVHFALLAQAAPVTVRQMEAGVSITL